MTSVLVICVHDMTFQTLNVIDPQPQESLSSWVKRQTRLATEKRNEMTRVPGLLSFRENYIDANLFISFLCCHADLCFGQKTCKLRISGSIALNRLLALWSRVHEFLVKTQSSDAGEKWNERTCAFRIYPRNSSTLELPPFPSLCLLPDQLVFLLKKSDTLGLRVVHGMSGWVRSQ